MALGSMRRSSSHWMRACIVGRAANQGSATSQTSPIKPIDRASRIAPHVRLLAFDVSAGQGMGYGIVCWMKSRKTTLNINQAINSVRHRLSV